MSTHNFGHKRTWRVVKFGDEEGRAVRLVGRMPFVSARDVLDILGLKDYRRARLMMNDLALVGHLDSVNTAGVYRSGWDVKRYVLTQDGIRRVASLEGISPWVVMDTYPVSVEWRRALLRRMEALETFYRLCGFVGAAYRDGGLVADERLAGGPEFLWRRSGWLDGTLAMGGGGGVAGVRVVRLGATAVRRAMLYRLGSMMKSADRRGVDAALVIVTGRTELGLVVRWLKRYVRTFQAYCVLERDVQAAKSWRDLELLRPARFGPASFSLGLALGEIRRRGSCEGVRLDGFEVYAKATVPKDRMLGRGRADREILMGAGLRRRERAALQAVCDWPLALREHLLRFRDVHKDVLASLVEKGLIYYVWDGGRARCLLSEAGLRYVVGRDRSKLGIMERRWRSVFVESGDEVPRGLEVFRVRGKGLGDGTRIRAEGGKLRTVSRQLTHMDGITCFLSALGEGGRGFTVLEVMPTHRSERWVGRGQGAILPDASFTAEVEGDMVSYVLEYERRAVSPAKMVERIAPYKRYYNAMFRYEDLGRSLVTLVLFDTDVNAGRFGSYCLSRRSTAWTDDGRRLPLYVSSLERMERVGVWGEMWLALGGRSAGEYVRIGDAG